MRKYSWVNAHFSPTGTTVKVARTIAQGSGCSVREVDLSTAVSPAMMGPDEILLAAVPVFGGRVPAVALERLSTLKGNGQPAVAVAVYGNRAFDDALLELKDALEANGFQVVAAGAFVAEHSIARSIAAGRPDAHDLETAKSFGASVMHKMAGGDMTAVQVPGDPAYQEKVGSDSPHPAAGEACVNCGTCAKNCPVGAIPLETPAETDGSKCINCMRCVSVCPTNARSLPEAMLSAVEGMLKQVASEPKQPELFL